MPGHPKSWPARIVALLAMGIAAGCGSPAQPDEGPEAVTKRFYELISASKTEGGTSPAAEAYKMIDARASNLNVHQFLEIIKNYPPGFKVDVGAAEIKGSHALVAISFNMPSSFGGGYQVKQQLPLNLDAATNTWRVDFTGDTYGMQKDDAIAADKAAAGRVREKP
jgi:hypothetical protein